MPGRSHDRVETTGPAARHRIPATTSGSPSVRRAQEENVERREQARRGTSRRMPVKRDEGLSASCRDRRLRSPRAWHPRHDSRGVTRSLAMGAIARSRSGVVLLNEPHDVRRRRRRGDAEIFARAFRHARRAETAQRNAVGTTTSWRAAVARRASALTAVYSMTAQNAVDRSASPPARATARHLPVGVAPCLVCTIPRTPTKRRRRSAVDERSGSCACARSRPDARERAARPRQHRRVVPPSCVHVRRFGIHLELRAQAAPFEHAKTRTAWLRAARLGERL